MAAALFADEAGMKAPSDGLTLTRRLAIFGLLLVSEFLYGWAWNTVDVLRPYVRETLHLSLIQAGSMYSAQGSGALTGAIVIGQLADRFGRRNMLSLLIFGYGAMLLAGTIVQSYPELLAQRFCLGLFMGASFPVSVGIYVNLFAPTVRGRLAAMLNVCFSGAIISLGVAMGMIAGQDWRILLWVGGVPPLFLSLLALILIPAHSAIDRFHVRSGKLPIGELFHRGVRRQTLLLAAMTGLNFFGYEAFSGWLTTYLTSERGLDAAMAGNLVAWQFAGNVIGGFVWGYAADRLGRRFNAIGFLIAAAMIAVYLSVPTDIWLLRIIGFIYGGSLCASVIWGPWLAELYPPHLRSTAASIFNWGRVISFFAPLITAKLAGSFGLTAAMASASLAFGVAAIIWLLQRETLHNRMAAH
jgi:MFS family permease